MSTFFSISIVIDVESINDKIWHNLKYRNLNCVAFNFFMSEYSKNIFVSFLKHIYTLQ